MSTGYDAIIVGGGHNGLVCAAFLARAGRKVLVLEARSIVGGFCTTAELLPAAPGFQISRCASEFILTNVKPSVIDQLELERYGLKWLAEDPDPIMTYLGYDGSTLATWKSVDRTVEEIRKFSRRDAERYPVLVDLITNALEVALPYVMGHPKRVRPDALVTMAWRLAKGRGKVAKGARILTSSIDSVLDEWFESEQLKCQLSVFALANFGPLKEVGSAFTLACLPGFHRYGMKRPIGGSINFPNALVRCIEAHGGEVRVGTRVESIDVTGGHARGVTLTDGESLQARQVVAAVDPWTLVNRLLAPSVIPQEVHEQVRAMPVNRFNISVFKVDAALSKAPEFPLAGRDRHVTSALTLCPSLDVLNHSLYDSIQGEVTVAPPLYAVQPSVCDRTLVPPGSDGETLYLYALAAPYQLSGGRDWATEKDGFADLMMKAFESYAPGSLDHVIDSVALSPPEFDVEYNAYRGSYNHVDNVLSTLGPVRPVPGLSSYKTPVDGLWHTGSGAFPMGWLHGWPGRATSRDVLRALRR